MPAVPSLTGSCRRPYLIRDHDAAYADGCRECLESMGIEEVLIAPRSACSGPRVERLVGSIRHECVNHLIVFGETYLKRVLVLISPPIMGRVATTGP